jgi:hypothetical protein
MGHAVVGTGKVAAPAAAPGVATACAGADGVVYTALALVPLLRAPTWAVTVPAAGAAGNGTDGNGAEGIVGAAT